MQSHPSSYEGRERLPLVSQLRWVDFLTREAERGEWWGWYFDRIQCWKKSESVEPKEQVEKVCDRG